MNTTSLIVTYNRLDKLKKTIQATLALPFEFVIVVDNASTDGTSEWLSSVNDPRLIVLSCKTNAGGAGGFKFGAEWIIKNLSTEWILFYDDDAYPKEDFFTSLDKENIIDDNVYVCNVTDKNGIRCKMNIPWKRHPNGLVGNLKYQLCPTAYIPDGNKNENVVSVSFVGMLISKKKLLKSIDYIYDELFIYFDDVYFGHHIVMNDITIHFLANVSIIHDVQDRGQFVAPWKIYYLVRNMILSKHIFKNYSPFDYTYILLRLIKYSLSILKHPNRREYSASFIKGLIDGIYNRRGKR